MEGVAGRGLVRRVNYQLLDGAAAARKPRWVAMLRATDLNSTIYGINTPRVEFHMISFSFCLSITWYTGLHNKH